MRNQDSGNATQSQVQSVDRAISVLELLARNGETGITEIAGELGVHKSTASRLLSVLETSPLFWRDSERATTLT